eukprot:CAMPEP_0114339576 /NCGR_PEP_ID=MMETSP0101-20121206/7817_1 /TAXON_ID=38822 ORGANISM="Pteridomonas danica, Strain PT" /NCGR_SAMPLE_ID=MMETSP0101 /ASSEMBLY_ACC=CAM_ASM_000211 /LENGTH=2941 /DNA_ID=CAMNT_0001472581 /DNA_START=113 /DNA_END=8938 /DNA_ORIENTATION=+
MSSGNGSGPKSELVESIERAIAPVLKKLGDMEYRLDKMGDPNTAGGGTDRSKSKSKSRSMSMMNKAGGDGVVGDLDPVMTGDLLYLKHIGDGLTNGFLCGDAAYDRVGVQHQGEAVNDALNFSDYVFRVVPMLAYRQRNELVALTASAERGGSVSRRSSVSGAADNSAERLLRQRVEAEQLANSNLLESLTQGGDKETLKYGSIFQLLHVSSGLFVTVKEDAAPFDPDCRALTLEEGSSAALFKIMPRFKAQTEGSIVYHSHSVVFESVRQRSMFLHTSSIAYDTRPNMMDATLPKNLRTGLTYETNVSPQFSTFSIHKYGRVDSVTAASLWTGRHFRLYHSQSESFVHASCDSQKSRAPMRQGDTQAHIPYLRTILDSSDVADPTNPANHSAKGLWSFEPLRRTTTVPTGWETAVRVRHVPSGMYLSVELSKPNNVSANETWYNAILVDDALTEETEMLSEGANLAPPESMIFHVHSADKTTAQYIPDSNVSIQLEHFFVDPLTGEKRKLYLHNTEKHKPKSAQAMSLSGEKKISIITSSFHLVFSTMRSAQDIFKLMKTAPIEDEHVRMIRSLLVVTNLQAVNFRDPNIPIKEDMKSFVKIMLRIIDLQHKGSSSHPNIDWIKKANSMMPAAFSALFVGESNPFVQRACRDMKLMDSIFDLGTTPYDRTYPKSPWGTEIMNGPMGIQKFVHVVLQRMCNGVRPSQEYFGRRRSLARTGDGQDGSKTYVPQLWMDTILEQLEDPLGPAVTLAKLLSSNEGLLKKYATPKLVSRFADMVRLLGPQPRLVNFFEAICTVQGRAVKANQEMVLRLTWMKPEIRSKTYLELHVVDFDKIPAQKPYGNVALPGGGYTDGKLKRNEMKHHPKNFIGKDYYEREEGFAPVYVSWSGSNDWKRDIEELWYSPESLGIPSFRVKDVADGREIVRLEELCWVLNPTDLCEPITGIEWDDFQTKKELNSDIAENFKRQHQLASFFVGQLKLHAAMCVGRSYNAIEWLGRSFTYPMLTCICYNPYLPQQIRSAAADFTRLLILDRFPQVANCGKAKLPEELWVYEAPEGSEGLDATPLIRELTLEDPKALPTFGIPKSHKYNGDPDPFNSFPTGFKFFLLRNVGNLYMKSFGTGTVVHRAKEENELAGAMCRIIAALLSFGFQSALPKFKELIPVLVHCLDGRSDVDYKTSDGDLVPFEPLKDRFRMTSNSPSVTALKVSVINSLLDIADIRSNFRLAKMLQRFKEYNEDSKLSAELKKFHIYHLVNKEDRYDGPLTDKLFEHFEEVFVKGDGFALMFENLAKEDVDTILLDCLMYDDDVLFAQALALLERTFTQRRKVLQALSDVILIQQPTLPLFGNVSEMTSELGYLTFLTRSYSVWGVCSRVSGPFGPDKYEQVLRTLDKLQSFFYEKAHEVEAPKEKKKKGMFGGLASRLGGGGGGNKPAAISNKNSTEDFAYGNGEVQNPVQQSELEAQLQEDEVEEDDEMQPTTIHQDIARSLNLQTTLVEALIIDYNLSFKGSICSGEEKVQSRKYLVDVQKRFMEVLIVFVTGNEANQTLIFNKAIPHLMNHLGAMKLPEVWPEDFKEELKQQLPISPGMNAEAVVIECLRKNEHLCSEVVTRELFVTFGHILNEFPDPSVSPVLEFFEIVCRPCNKAIIRNQSWTVDVFLSDDLPNLKNCVASVFGIGNPCAAPDRIARLLCACIAEDNIQTASHLQRSRLTMDANLLVIEGFITKIKEQEDIVDDAHLGEMLQLLALMMDILVVDPRIFRRKVVWEMVALVCGPLINRLGAVTIGKTRRSLEFKKRLNTTLAASKVAGMIIAGARSLGLLELEAQYEAEIRTNADSILNTAYDIYHADVIAADKDSSQVLEALIDSIDQRKLGEVAKRRGRKSSIFEAVIKPVDEAPKSVLAVPSPLAVLGGGGGAADKPVDIDHVEEEEVDLSSIEAYEPPVTMLSNFSEALWNNPHIMNKLSARRFEFARKLENAELTTDPSNPKNSNLPPYAVKVTWVNIVDRMVRYVKAHNFDANEEHNIRIFNALRSSLLRARSTESGEVRDRGDLDDEEYEIYKNKQTFLDQRGVTAIVCTAIATHTAGIEGNLADCGLELLQELLNAGNEHAQQSVFEHVAADKDGKFFGHLKQRIEYSRIAIHERKERTALSFEGMTEPQREAYENASQTFEILQQLCEGHNLSLQDLIREQTMHQSSINLAKMILEMFTMQVETSQMLRRMEEVEVDLMVSNLDCIIEYLQGPCKGNQEMVSKDDAFLNGLDKVIQSSFHSRINRGLRLSVKTKAIVCIASLLEGRTNKEVHFRLAEIFQPLVFEIFRGFLAKQMATATSKKLKLDEEETEDREEDCMEAVVCLQRVNEELEQIPKFRTKMHELLKQRKDEDFDTFDNVACIEVLWEGRVEGVNFPLPPEVRYLSESTKNAFLMEADVSTAEKRCKQLLAAAPGFISEMSQVHGLAEESALYGFLYRNLTSIKWSMYALVVLLNINIVMASYGKEKGKTKGYVSAAKGPASPEYTLSVVITWILGLINVLGYVVIVCFLAVTEIPIIIRQTDELVENALADPNIREYYDFGAFTWWFVTLIFNIMFIIMHSANYPNDTNPGLYLFLVFGINLPWTLSCVRNYILVPTTPRARFFVVIYDVALTKPFLRNHVLLMAASMAGFQSSPFFTLMLLDIVNNSSMLADIVKSLTRPLPQLGIVFYTIIITVIIYAQFGLAYFEDFFMFDVFSDDDDPGCHSVVACFFLIMYGGVTTGSIAEVMDNTSNSDGDRYIWRMVYDLTFFVWVGIMLFNVLTGLIVDTFGALRDEANEREDTLSNQCYICGFTRSGYDDIGVTNAPSFDIHAEEEHNIWNYVYFYRYLTTKDPSDYNGVESYVADMIEQTNLGWLPVRTSLYIQNAGGYVDDEEDDVSKVVENTIQQEFTPLAKTMKSVESRLEALEEALKK